MRQGSARIGQECIGRTIDGPSRAAHGLAVWLLAFATQAASAGAQLLPQAPEEGFFEVPLPTGPGALAECATPLTVTTVAPVTDLGCAVVDVTPLGATDRPRAWMVAYRRAAVVEYDQFADSMSIDELVLVRQETDRRFLLVWHLPQVRTYSFLEQVQSVQRDEGILVSYLICLNGTGGCAQHFLLGAPAWSVVGQPYLDELRERLPEGGSLHKGRRIDLSSLEGTQPIAFPGDANCCPSGTMRFRVALVGHDLRLVSAELSGR